LSLIESRIAASSVIALLKENGTVLFSPEIFASMDCATRPPKTRGLEDAQTRETIGESGARPRENRTVPFITEDLGRFTYVRRLGQCFLVRSPAPGEHPCKHLPERPSRKGQLAVFAFGAYAPEQK
jgi:hypothetical protein